MTDEPRDEDESSDREVEYEVNEVAEPTDAFQPVTEQTDPRASSEGTESEAEKEASNETDSLEPAGGVNEVVEPTDAFQPATEQDTSDDDDDGDVGGGAGE